MHDVQPRPVKTGSDPRSLADFIALREEMSKLTHPARPDVDWKHVETLSLSLFELNGVELQTGAWYTLARSHLARVQGMNEGLSILNALLSHQWAQLWPQPVHVRAEILNGLFQRLQKLFRTYSLGHDDVSALMQAEGLLRGMNDILVRQELKHACKTTPLIQQINSALTRLENSSSPNDTQPAVTLPPQALAAVPVKEEVSPVSRLVYVIRPEPEVNVQVVHDTPPPPKRWPAFIAGMAAALLLSAATVFGWQAMHQPEAATQAMVASVTWVPEPMNPAQTEAFRGTKNGLALSAMWLPRITDQVNRVMALKLGIGRMGAITAP
jgi:type VI secretion system protein VasL